ncbi:hypothetical protein ACX80I_00980 [Arthrobacter sp. MDT3-44]
MPEIPLSPINTVPVAAAVTTAEEHYIRQAVAEDRLPSLVAVNGEVLVSIDQVRELQRSDGLKA